MKFESLRKGLAPPFKACQPLQNETCEHEWSTEAPFLKAAFCYDVLQENGTSCRDGPNNSKDDSEKHDMDTPKIDWLEVLTYFAGTFSILTIFALICSLGENFVKWRSCVRRCRKRMRLVRNVRCTQKIPSPKKHTGGMKKLFVYFLLFCHCTEVFAMDMASMVRMANSDIHSIDDPVHENWFFETGEPQYVKSLTTDSSDPAFCSFTVWEHRHAQVDSFESRIHLVDIRRSEAWEKQLMEQLNFLQDFGPRFWHRVIPTPYSYAARRPNLIVWQETSQRQNYGIYLIKFIDKDLQDGRISWGTLLVQKQHGLTPMEKIFDKLKPGHRCAVDFRCFIRSRRTFEWPEGGFYADGALLTAVHEPHEVNADATVCEQHQRPGDLASPSIFVSDRAYGNQGQDEGDAHSFLQATSVNNELMFCLESQRKPPVDNECIFDEQPSDKHDGNPTAAWRYGAELVSHDVFQHRAVTSATTHIVGGRQISLELDGLASQNDESTATIHMHGLATNHLETKSRNFQMSSYEDWMDLYADIRNAWIGYLDFFQDIKILYVTPQPFHANRDGLHIIVDLRPDEGGSPQLFTVDLQFGILPSEKPIFETFRCHRGRKTCSEMLEDLGFTHMCERREASCLCRSGVTYYEGTTQFINFGGAGINLEVSLRTSNSAEENHHDESSLMMTSRVVERRIRRFFLYRADYDEPAALQRFDPSEVPIPGLTEEDRIIFQYQHWEQFGGESRITLHVLQDQPADLVIFQARGYALVDEDARPVNKILSVVDIGFYLPGSAMTARGPHPADEWREVKYLPALCGYRDLLRELGISSFCSEPEDQCTIWHRGVIWDPGDEVVRTLQDGDYIIARVLQRNTALPLHIQWSFAQEECGIDLMQLSSQAENSEAEPTGNATLPVLEEGEIEEGEVDMDDDSSLLMLNRTFVTHRMSATRHAFLRLPPPGNGKVSFSAVVEVWDAGEMSFKLDRSCNDLFYEDMCTLRGEDACRDNPFFKCFAHELRYEEIRPVSLVSELSDSYLPFDTSTTTTCGIDLRPVEALRDILTRHVTLPNLCTSEVQWNQQAIPWISLPSWGFQPIRRMHMYTDGSCRDGKASASAILFVYDGAQWYYGGFCQHRLDDGCNNFTAEMMGSLIALKWSWDIMRCMKFHGYPMPTLTLHYDCKASGLMTEGRWQGSWDDPLYKSTRAFAQLIEMTFLIEIYNKHERGHSGNPGNEAADSVARDGLDREKKERFWDLLHRNDVVDLLQWIWVLENEEMQNFVFDGILQVPKARAVYEPKVAESIKGQRQQIEQKGTCHFDVRFATYNVLTLRTNKCSRKAGPGYLRSLFSQCMEGDIHFLALQETRISREHLMKDPDYFFLSSTADKQGNGGMIFAWSRKLPFAVDQDGCEIFLQENDVSLIFKDEQTLLVKVENDYLRFIALCLHGPHTGYPDDHIESFWKNALALVSPKWDHFPLVLLGDTNARMGQRCNEHVGNFGAEQGTKACDCLFDFLCAQGLWLPATFEETHTGSHHTWYHPSGQGSRLDYCAIPIAWAVHEVENFVQEDLGIHDTLFDHQPVVLHVRGSVRALGEPDSWRGKKASRIMVDLTDELKVDRLKHSFKQIPSYSWDLDIHRHVEFLHRAVARHAKKVSHKPCHVWKEHLQEDTWDAIKEKALVKKEFFTLRGANKVAFLRCFWSLWRHGKCELLENEMHKTNVELARAMNSFRKASIKAQSLVRRDDNKFLSSFVQRVEEAAGQKDLKSFWHELKRFIPKHREKKKGAQVRQNETLKPQWAPHLCQMEAGSIMSAKEIYDLCIERQNANPGIAPRLDEVPSLLAVEWTLRESKAGKQGGMEGLEPSWIRRTAKELAPALWRVALKQNLWGVEALQFKGGALAMISKPGGSKNEASGYRGILLSAEFGKRLQALSRKELIATINPRKPPLQLGGYQSMEPAFGAHFARTFVHICSTLRCSSVIIFVDLKAAYHSLIRQFLAGRCQGDHEDLKEVYKCLTKEGIDVQAVMKAWDESCILEEMQASKALQSKMQEYNMDTWSNVFGTGCLVKTCRGSRPGSPLADAQFSGLMASIGHQLQEILSRHEGIRTACNMVELEPATIIWADDLALAFPIVNGDDVLAAAGEIMQETQKVFKSKGLTINFKKGKSEAVATVCGHKARETRQHILTEPNISIGPEETQPLRLEGRYKHLGTYQQCGGGLSQEIAYRIATTWSSFKQIRRILTRHSLDLKVRLRLAHSLLFSKLFYGSGAWGQLTGKQLRKLHCCYLGVLRAITGKTQSKRQIHKGWTDDKILAEYEAPCIRTLLAVSRLCYAKRIWCNGGQEIQQILRREHDICDTSWMQGLKEDLQWIYEVQGKEWGESFEQTCQFWEQGKKGWKSFVRNAQRRHALQEAISFLMTQKFRLGGEDETDFAEGEGWLCHCGAWFEQWRSLQVHRHKKHGEHSEVYDMISGTQCPACLLQLWTPQRLHMHLRYQPRGGQGNWCFGMIAARKMRREHDVPETADLPMPGIQRRDAIRCAGPLWFGMEAEDVNFARNRILELEEQFSNAGIPEPLDFIDEGLTDEMLFVFEAWPENWEDELTDLLRLYGDELKFVVTLLFSGGRFQWQEHERQLQWRFFLEHQRLGCELGEWFDLRLRVAFVEQARQIGSTRADLDRREQLQRKKTSTTRWARSILKLRTAHLPPKIDIDQLSRPGVSCRTLLSTLKECH